ncbi:hypothetical protein SAMN06296386_104237 [Lachnospiraceae bacterium]|nr:hypothetical protein SAMN06296386_104237 [Lachnospiraceae bacterium]
MINIRVSAVFRITDGFTGKPVPMGAFKAEIDGLPVKPLSKGDGYFVFLNLESGEHTLRIYGYLYQDELIMFNSSEHPAVQVVTLKPGEHYRYGVDARHYEIECDIDSVWAASDIEGMELKVAEDKADEGVTEANVFASAAFSTHGYPDNFLILDGKKSEIVCIEMLDEGKANFTMPLKYAHKRGTRFIPAQHFRAEGGKAEAVFRKADTIQVFKDDGKVPVEIHAE